MSPATPEELELPPGVHPIAAALPWYINGTLQSIECDQVAEHLQQCEACRTELDSLLKLSSRLQSTYHSMPAPSPQVRKTVMAEVHAASQPPVASPAEPTSPGIGIPELIRRGFALKWAPTIALAVVLMQTGLLLWSLPNRAPHPHVTSRSVAVTPLRLRIVFNPLATEGQIRSALRELGANVVAGPGENNAYVIEIAAGEPKVLQQRLAALRENRELVQSVSAQ